MNKAILCFLAALLLFAMLTVSFAIDISPSRPVADPKTYGGGKGKFSLFTSDPKRIFRANAIDFKSIRATIEVQPNPISVSQLKSANATPFFKAVLNIKNSGKKPVTLSFPNAQRYDIMIKNSADKVVYQWSSDKDFAEEFGTILLNYDDRAAYNIEILFDEVAGGLAPGKYTIHGVVNNYPELLTSQEFTVTP
ncbi:MAG: BsuPI-related putative proteinase inhibitor [Candidatus Methylacidiphilales bacterium]|nr:BsuPI-related putative proteinase inhibitor [Candidatus Methylacidiphilales bacterium]